MSQLLSVLPWASLDVLLSWAVNVAPVKDFRNRRSHRTVSDCKREMDDTCAAVRLYKEYVSSQLNCGVPTQNPIRSDIQEHPRWSLHYYATSIGTQLEDKVLQT